MKATPLQQAILRVIPPEGLTMDQLMATLNLNEFKAPGKATPSSLQVQRATESLHRKQLATIRGNRVYNPNRSGK